MEKQKSPCKRSEASESVCSESDKDSDGKLEGTMESPVGDIKSQEVSLKVETDKEDLKDSLKTLTEKLSAALANVSAKDDLVKQHVKVAEEAVAGWEKAENEVVELKEKLEAITDKNTVLEDRVSHLDGALKECVRQLRQARDEQEQNIQEAVIERTQELQSCKTNLENRILELQNQVEAATKYDELSQMAESVARENLLIRQEILAQREELEIRTIERDLSTQAAEAASKQHLDSIKKVAKLEAECRKLRMLAKSSTSFNDHRSADSHSDGGERMETSCSDSWPSSLIPEFYQFKNEKTVNKNIEGTSSSIEIDLMGDFLEMERLVALPETPDENGKNGSESISEEIVQTENLLRGEIEVLTCRTKQLEEKLEKLEAEKDELESEVKCTKEVDKTLRFELEAMVCDKMELENKLEKMEIEKAELQISFDIIKEKYEESQVCLQEVEMKLEEIQKELKLANDLKTEVESQIMNMEEQEKIKSAKIESLQEDMRKEMLVSDELRRKCEILEEELTREKEENNNIKRETTEPKIKQEDIETAAGKLANCQKTIASLGKQLQSLATLEDFLIDTASIPGCGSVTANGVSSRESWKVQKNEPVSARYHLESTKPDNETAGAVLTFKNINSSSSNTLAPVPAPAVSSVVSSNRGSNEKNRNGFAKVFTRSKDGIHLAI